MMRVFVTAAITAVLGLTSPLLGQRARGAASPEAFSPVDLRVPLPPRPLLASGQAFLAYEVLIANMAPRPVTIDRVEVRDASPGRSGAVLLALDTTALDAALRRLGTPPQDSEVRQLGPGQSAMLFVWVATEAGAVPRLLTHRVMLRMPPRAGADPEPVAVEGLDVAVDRRLPRVVGPPLRGDRWLAANGPDNSTGHRRARFSLTGQARIAQRFAIDWVQLYEDGRTYRGDPSKNESYRAFGADVRAVADGTVVEVVDGIPENAPDPVARAVPMTPRTLTGNSVLLDIGQGAWATYAHLQPGSISVRKGERVRRGQVLGRVGNTGNSTEPHLHFQIADRPYPLDAEGLPYGISTFDLVAESDEVTRALRPAGQSLEIDRARLAEWLSRPARRRQGEMPLLNAVVTFP